VPLRLVIDPARPPRCVFFVRSHCEQDSARRTASQPPVPEDARRNAERQAVEFGVEIGCRNLCEDSGHGADYSCERGDPMNKAGLVIIWLALLLAACGGSLRGDASAGPNPGGGFYGAPNIDIGRINP
jgi:hypothetical protein